MIALIFRPSQGGNREIPQVESTTDRNNSVHLHEIAQLSTPLQLIRYIDSMPRTLDFSVFDWLRGEQNFWTRMARDSQSPRNFLIVLGILHEEISTFDERFITLKKILEQCYKPLCGNPLRSVQNEISYEIEQAHLPEIRHCL